MIDICNKNKMNFILFNSEKAEFVNIKGEKIDNLRIFILSLKRPPPPKRSYNEMIKSYNQKDEDDNNKDAILMAMKHFSKRSKNPIYCLSTIDIKNIINVLEDDSDLGKNIKNIKFINRERIENEKEFQKDKVYVGRLNVVFTIFILYFSKKFKKIKSKILGDSKPKENEIDYLPYFDVYEIEN